MRSSRWSARRRSSGIDSKSYSRFWPRTRGRGSLDLSLFKLPPRARITIEGYCQATRCERFIMPTGKAIHRVTAARHVTKKTAPRAKTIKTRTVKKKSPLARSRSTVSDAKHREKKYGELFGPSFPKGKGLNAQGEPIQAADCAAQGWSILQFPPRPGRLSWIYATHGLSTCCAKGKERPTRTELVIHWRDKDTLPLKVLAAAAKYILESGNALAPGQLIT